MLINIIPSINYVNQHCSSADIHVYKGGSGLFCFLSLDVRPSSIYTQERTDRWTDWLTTSLESVVLYHLCKTFHSSATCFDWENCKNTIIKFSMWAFLNTSHIICKWKENWKCYIWLPKNHRTMKVNSKGLVNAGTPIIDWLTYPWFQTGISTWRVNRRRKCTMHFQCK